MSSDNVPEEGDILEGTVVRVEAYGAFCRLHNNNNNNNNNGRVGADGHGYHHHSSSAAASRRLPQGLIHISQLVADQRVERVEDVISVDDHVWVKVLKVEMDPNTQRWRIQLSRKDVSQDGMATDLGLERETRDNQRNQLETHLNSMIGMGVARDPMADRLIMKTNAGARSGAIFRGGYCLVADDEGEPELPPPAAEPASAVPSTTTRVAPMGRGRGTTLPAWMTQPSDGPTGEDKDEASESGSSSGGGPTKRKKKHKKKHSKSSHKKRDRKEENSSNGRKRRRHRERDASESDSRTTGDYHSDGDSSHSRRDRRKRAKNDKRKTSREHQRSSRDGRSGSSQQSRDRHRGRRSRSRSINR